MKKAFHYLIILSALFFYSCNDVVQIKLDEGSKLIVIDAFVNDLREKQKIRVITSDNYFSNRAAPPVTNATVILKDLTSGQQYNFTYETDGYYTYAINAADTIAKINHSYVLNVSIDGYTYYSSCSQKRTAVLDTILAQQDNGGGFGPPSKDSSYSCLLFARDKADNNPDYYWIKTFRNDTLFNGSADINICIDGTGGVATDAPQDTIMFTPPATLLSFKTYKKFESCKVQIHSLSRENYFFFIQALAQINNGGLFATTPENVKTNIITPEGAKIKAIGRFNMASVVEQKIIVK
ncbi:MAG: DUF4249 domain-containing protein [Bacteroidetes bacterium]|nr:DUF4249 domain-containing protein [Bacteroidota bacterium]